MKGAGAFLYSHLLDLVTARGPRGAPLYPKRTNRELRRKVAEEGVVDETVVRYTTEPMPRRKFSPDGWGILLKLLFKSPCARPRRQWGGGARNPGGEGGPEGRGEDHRLHLPPPPASVGPDQGPSHTRTVPPVDLLVLPCLRYPRA